MLATHSKSGHDPISDEYQLLLTEFSLHNTPDSFIFTNRIKKGRLNLLRPGNVLEVGQK